MSIEIKGCSWHNDVLFLKSIAFGLQHSVKEYRNLVGGMAEGQRVLN